MRLATDQLSQLELWVNFPKFLGFSDWLVFLRKPTRLEQCGSILQKLQTQGIIQPTRDPYTYEVRSAKPRLLHIVHTDAPDISSTFIREQFALGKKDVMKKNIKTRSTRIYRKEPSLWNVNKLP